MALVLIAETAGGGGLDLGWAWWQWVAYVVVVVALYLGLVGVCWGIRCVWRHYHKDDSDALAPSIPMWSNSNVLYTANWDADPEPRTEEPADPTLPESIPLDPDTVLVGYRGFHLIDGGLVGSYRQTVWDGGTFSAMCGSSSTSAAQCLADSQWSRFRHASEPGCGIYSRRKLTDLLRHAPSSSYEVYASVVNFGIVVPAETGFRAQHTRIEQLWLIGERGDWNETVASYLSRRYNAPCEITTQETLWLDHGAALTKEREAWEASASKSAQSVLASLSALRSLSPLSAQSAVLNVTVLPIANSSPSAPVTDPTTAGAAGTKT